MRMFLLLITLFLASVAGLYVYQDPGYALFQYEDWVIEMPLWLAFILAFLGITLFYALLTSLAKIVASFQSGSHWLRSKQRHKARQQAEDSFIALTEGRWAKAELLSKKALHHHEQPLIACLQAAKAAQEQGAFDRRDEYLMIAHQKSPHASFAIALATAQLQYQEGNLVASLNTTQQLLNKRNPHPQVIKLLSFLHQSLEQWEALDALLPLIKKSNALNEMQFTSLAQKTIAARLLELSKGSDPMPLMNYWRQLSRVHRANVPLSRIYIEQLKRWGQHNEAEVLLRDLLKKEWHPALVKLYGEIKSHSIPKQIAQAESWLKTHPNDSGLLLCIARLCLQHQLWGKAKSYLEVCLSLDPAPEVYAELGRLLEHLGDTRKSLDCYQKGLMTFAEVIPIEGKAFQQLSEDEREEGKAS